MKGITWIIMMIIAVFLFCVTVSLVLRKIALSHSKTEKQRPYPETEYHLDVQQKDGILVYIVYTEDMKFVAAVPAAKLDSVIITNNQ